MGDLWQRVHQAYSMNAVRWKSDRHGRVLLPLKQTRLFNLSCTVPQP